MSIFEQLIIEIFGDYYCYLHWLSYDSFFLEVVDSFRRPYYLDFYLNFNAQFKIECSRSVRYQIDIEDLESICEEDGFCKAYCIDFAHPNSVGDCKTFLSRWISSVESLGQIPPRELI